MQTSLLEDYNLPFSGVFQKPTAKISFPLKKAEESPWVTILGPKVTNNFYHYEGTLDNLTPWVTTS